jgi:hypothetical protein
MTADGARAENTYPHGVDVPVSGRAISGADSLARNRQNRITGLSGTP